MIKASELRIGNYYKGGIEIKGSLEAKLNFSNSDRVFQLTEQHLVVLAGYKTEWLRAVYPIPLTEEWLLKFGFELVHKANKHYFINDPNGFKDTYKIHIFPTINDQWHIAYSDTSSGKEQDYIPTTKIKHVHQLQNLYFALTGEELIIK